MLFVLNMRGGTGRERAVDGRGCWGIGPSGAYHGGVTGPTAVSGFGKLLAGERRGVVVAARIRTREVVGLRWTRRGECGVRGSFGKAMVCARTARELREAFFQGRIQRESFGKLFFKDEYGTRALGSLFFGTRAERELREAFFRG